MRFKYQEWLLSPAHRMSPNISLETLETIKSNFTDQTSITECTEFYRLAFVRGGPSRTPMGTTVLVVTAFRYLRKKLRAWGVPFTACIQACSPHTAHRSIAFVASYREKSYGEKVRGTLTQILIPTLILTVILILILTSIITLTSHYVRWSTEEWSIQNLVTLS